MLAEPIVPPPTRPSRILTLGLLALGIVAGVGGTLLLRPSAHGDHDHGTASANAPKKQMFQCPMHPQILQDHPGTCPICGMDLVLMDGQGTAGAGLADTRVTHQSS